MSGAVFPWGVFAEWPGRCPSLVTLGYREGRLRVWSGYVGHWESLYEQGEVKITATRSVRDWVKGHQSSRESRASGARL